MVVIMLGVIETTSKKIEKQDIQTDKSRVPILFLQQYMPGIHNSFRQNLFSKSFSSSQKKTLYYLSCTL